MFDVANSWLLFVCFMVFGTPCLIFAATRKTWRSIIISSLVAAIVFSCLIYLSLSIGDLGLVFYVLLFLPAAISYAVGSVIAIVVCVLRSGKMPTSSQKLAFRCLITLSYLSLIGTFILYPNYINRSPDAACQQRVFHASVGEQQLQIPASSPIVISIAAEKPNSAINARKYLRDAKHLRSLCHYADKHPGIIQLRRVEFHLGKLWSARPGSSILLKSYYRDFCKIASKTEWGQQLCDSSNSPEALHFPDSFTVFTDLPKLVNTFGRHYRDFLRQIESFKKRGYVHKIEQVDNFDRITIHLNYIHNFDKKNPPYYWVARNDTWLTTDGNPYFLRCKPAGKQGLKCSTLYGTSDGFYVMYSFFSQLENVTETAKLVDDKLHWLLQQMSTQSNQ